MNALPSAASQHAAILRGILFALLLSEVAGLAGAAPGIWSGGLGALLALPFFAPSLLGAFAAQWLLRPERREVAASITLAALLVWPLWQHLLGQPFALISATASSLGLGSLAVLAAAAFTQKQPGRRAVLDVLQPALILPGFVLLAHPMGYLLAALWPTTWDHRLYLMDAAFGAPLSFVVGGWAAAVPLLLPLCLAVYVALPLALMLVHALRQRRRLQSSDALVAFIAVTVVGYLGYMAVPVAGPVYAFGELFPGSPPDPSLLDAGKALAPPVPRNCMPSLHSAWALLVWWNARALGRGVRVIAAVFLAITLLATVALGFHYVVDLVAAFPLAMAAQVWATRVSDEKLRRRAIGLGLGATAAWMAMVTWLPSLPHWPALVLWVIAAAVVVGASLFERRIDAVRVEEAGLDEPESAQQGAAVAETDATGVSEGGWRTRGLALSLLAISFAAFVHWAIARQTLGVVFGATFEARILMAVIALVGVAAGVGVGGRFAALLANPLRVVAWVAALSAATSWASNWMLPWVEQAFVAQVRSDGVASWGAAISGLALQTLSFGPLAFLGGVAWALFVEELRRASRPLGEVVGVGTSCALAGVAVGGLATGSVVIPSLYSLLLPTALQAAVAVMAAVASSGAAPRAELPPEDGEEREVVVTALPRPEWTVVGAIAALGAIGGLWSVACLLAQRTLIGDTVHTRAYVPVLLAVGLGVGAALARRVSRKALRTAGPPVLAALSLALWIGVPLWLEIPGYFASFAGYGEAQGMFARPVERELVRLFVTVWMVLPVAIGFGVAILWLGSFVRTPRPDHASEAITLVGALAMAASAAGALLAMVLVIPVLGVLPTLAFVGGVLAVAASVLMARGAGWQRFAALVVLAVGTLGAWGSPADRQLAMAASQSGLSFAPELGAGELIDWRSDVEGLVAVRREEAAGRVVLVVDGRGRPASPSVEAVAPGLAYTPGRDRALVLGLGSGASVRALRSAGLKTVVVAEPNRGQVELVRRHLDGELLDDPAVRVWNADARSFLRTEPGRFDLVDVENSAVFRPDVAALYTREFYASAASHLSPGGVLQQQLDLRRLSAIGMVSVLASARLHFEELRIQVNGERATLIGCGVPCAIQAEALSRESVAESWTLAPAQLDRLLETSAQRLGVAADALGSTDRDMFLAYHAPASFLVPADQVPESLGLLHSARTASAAEGAIP